MKKKNVVLNRSHYKRGSAILRWALAFDSGAPDRIKSVLADAKSVERFSRLCNADGGVVCRSDVFIALGGRSVKSFLESQGG